MKIKIFDTCVYPESTDNKSIYKLSKKLASNSISHGCCMLSCKEKNYNLLGFYNNVKKRKNLIPVAGIKKTNNLYHHLKEIYSIGYKLIKIHPRNLGLNLKKNFSFYEKIFQISQKYNFIIMWCTFDSWERGQLPNHNQLNLLSKLINKLKKQKIILMHGGGIDIMKYYERFRFCNNVYLDLSYTFSFFQNYSTTKDMLFLINKFDKRIVMGSDFPTIDFKRFKKTIETKLKKITKRKRERILFKNMKKLTDE